jgi:cytochrome c biogenesis protein CcmG/thiol:disulfide interchange protein DsbE
MRSPFIAVTIATLMLAPPAVGAEGRQSAPEFELPARQGLLKLADYKGKTVYLDFWASWCGPCRQSFPWLNDMQARYGGKGLRVIGINVDQNSEDAKSFLKQHPASFDIAFDDAGKVPRAYAIKGMPTSVLIGPDGRVLSVHNGFRNDYRQDREQEIRRSLNIEEK